MTNISITLGNELCFSGEQLEGLLKYCHDHGLALTLKKDTKIHPQDYHAHVSGIHAPSMGDLEVIGYISDFMTEAFPKEQNYGA